MKFPLRRLGMILFVGCFVSLHALPIWGDESVQVEPQPKVEVPNLSGNWSGTWLSYSNGHNGPMKATFCQLDGNHYQVHFKGRFWKLIPFNYKAVLTVTGYGDGRVYLQGSHHLGPLLGTFTYNAWASSTQFVAGYCAKKDRGQFVMARSCQ